MIRVDIQENKFPDLAKRFGPWLEKTKYYPKMIGVVEAKKRARVRTGLMRSSIHTVDSGFQADVHYAKYNEYGTRRMSAKPFMRPAAEIAFREWVKKLERIEQDLG